MAAEPHVLMVIAPDGRASFCPFADREGCEIALNRVRNVVEAGVRVVCTPLSGAEKPSPKPRPDRNRPTTPPGPPPSPPQPTPPAPPTPPHPTPPVTPPTPPTPNPPGPKNQATARAQHR